MSQVIVRYSLPFLHRFLVRLAPVLVEDIHHPERDAVVVLQPDLVGQDEVGVFIKHSRADGSKRILVAQFGMDAFPDAETEVGADVEIMRAVCA